MKGKKRAWWKLKPRAKLHRDITIDLPVLQT